jgi:hypothetical protein
MRSEERGLSAMENPMQPQNNSNATSNSNSGMASGGNVSNSGNISQTVNVPGASKASHTISIVIPLLAASISAIGGAYAQNQFAHMRAPERTQAGTNTLIGLSQETLELAKARQTSTEVIDRIRQIEEQARAVEASAALLQRPAGVVSGTADFWLPKNGGVTLGRTTSFGVQTEYGNGTLAVIANGNGQTMPSGGRINFKSDAGKNCFVTYVGKAPGSSLYGFKTECGS